MRTMMFYYYLNGAEAFKADFGVTISREIVITPGDRLVFKLHNKWGPYGIKVVFISTDRKRAIHFSNKELRCLRTTGRMDFDSKDFKGFPQGKRAKGPEANKGFTFPTSADWVWGETNAGDTYLASEITPFMFTNFREK